MQGSREEPTHRSGRVVRLADMFQWVTRNQIGTVQAGALEYLLYFEDRDTGVRLYEKRKGKQTQWVLVIEADTGDDLDVMKKVAEREWVERQRPSRFISDSL